MFAFLYKLRLLEKLSALGFVKIYPFVRIFYSKSIAHRNKNAFGILKERNLMLTARAVKNMYLHK